MCITQLCTPQTILHTVGSQVISATSISRAPGILQALITRSSLETSSLDYTNSYLIFAFQ